MEKIINLDSVDTYNKLHGLETLHPLVTVIDHTAARTMPNNIRLNYGLYALFLKEGKSCEIRYGRRTYDYQDGTIVSIAPGQVVEINYTDEDLPTIPKVRGLLFHPDLIRGTSLGQNIKNYNFFSYASNEALHLSQRERQVIIDCMDKTQMELNHAIDNHSKQLIVTNIELILGYCLRFYERQFITRQEVNGDILQRFETLLNQYFDNQIQENGLPSVRYFADHVHLSPNYFGDLVKKETGKSPQEFIQHRLIERAKDHIATTNLTMSEIAYQLGFAYPQHFSRLFKKQTGITPAQFRERN